MKLKINSTQESFDRFKIVSEINMGSRTDDVLFGAQLFPRINLNSTDDSIYPECSRKKVIKLKPKTGPGSGTVQNSM